MSTIAIDRTVRSTAPRSTSSRRSGGVRLTRRGRVVVLGLAFVVVAMAAVWLASGSAAGPTSGGEPTVEIVTVAPGDTLWGIASDAAAATGEDIDDVMEHIKQLNALDGSSVDAGQELRIPGV